MKDFLQPWFGQKNDLAYSYWHGTQAILPSDMVQGPAPSRQAPAAEP